MSWVNQDCISWFQLFCIKVLKTGRIPSHIAFIMDGNRRYAKKNKVKSSTGHSRGFDKLAETLKWCLDLGIPEVTVYAFSIENFKRSEDEVKTLMDLAQEKFQRLLDDVDQMKEWGVRVVVVGRLSLLPPELQSLVARCMLATLANNKLRLNIAYGYTGRDEISRSVTHIVKGVETKEIDPSDIDADLISGALELGEPELLVRTSGELRLSDFMLWQLSNTVLYFKDVLWPDFSIWNLLEAIIHYQRNAPVSEMSEESNLSLTKQQFLEHVEAKRLQKLYEYAAS